MELHSKNEQREIHASAHVSIGIIAWNEAETIGIVLRSVLNQSLFERLQAKGLSGEILVLANGCTDGTEVTARTALNDLQANHPELSNLSWKVQSLAERGKLNAWNQFVHRLSAPNSRFLFLLDSDILLKGRDTLWNMLQTLRDTPAASVCVDTPIKRLSGDGKKTLISRLSRRATSVTAASPGQLCGQLYCIRSEVARNIYLPRDLSSCDDGFIKSLVCTDSLTAPINLERICVAPNAEHLFDAYTSPVALIKNQKRQIMGQTIAHILLDQYLPKLSINEREHLAEALMSRESTDPAWLKRLVADHVARQRFPWRLYPELLTHRFKRAWRLRPSDRLACMPAVLAQSVVSLWASCLAYRSLKRGCTDYWPRAGRPKGDSRGPANFRTKPLQPTGNEHTL